MGELGKQKRGITLDYVSARGIVFKKKLGEKEEIRSLKHLL
ncbi:MAG: hypothetical protein N4A76_05855 [Firmicutes bacterium]|jgi:hypothetical protein|nr:hypothetical protein [Bacillota bacterium]